MKVELNELSKIWSYMQICGLHKEGKLFYSWFWGKMYLQKTCSLFCLEFSMHIIVSSESEMNIVNVLVLQSIVLPQFLSLSPNTACEP